MICIKTFKFCNYNYRIAFNITIDTSSTIAVKQLYFHIKCLLFYSVFFRNVIFFLDFKAKIMIIFSACSIIFSISIFFFQYGMPHGLLIFEDRFCLLKDNSITFCNLMKMTNPIFILTDIAKC